MSRIHGQARRAIRFGTLGTVIAMLMVAMGLREAAAQQWKYVYGPDSGGENGMNRVTPVTGTCASTTPPGGGSAYNGYIAVGTSTSLSANGDVYVVRTNNAGASVWEKTYDIGDAGRADIGMSIVELADGSGFAITGTTDLGLANYDVFILKIDCQGGLVWVNTYGTTDQEFGMDIIETTTGNPFRFPIATSAGDLVVAGQARYPSGTPPLSIDAYLLRVTSTGVFIWDAVYGEASPGPGLYYEEGFRALTEASTVGGASTGDIIAVGDVFVPGATQQGYVARVNGDNGSIGGTTYQNVAHYGGCTQMQTVCGTESFNSVIELTNPSLTDFAGQPDVVVAGSTSSPGHSEIYVVRLFGGDPCSQARERTLGEANVTATANQAATCVREVGWEMGGDTINQYDLVLTGFTDQVNAQEDLFLLAIDPTTLGQTNTLYRVYGNTASGMGNNEEGYSLEPVAATNNRTEGFILCGVNLDDPLGVSDPADMYLIKTDTLGFAASDGSCEDDPPINNRAYGWIPTCLSPNVLTGGSRTEDTVDIVDIDADDEICIPIPKPFIPQPDVAVTGLGVSVSLSPNPLPNGVSAGLQLQGVSEGHATVRITDMQGRVAVIRTVDIDGGRGEIGALSLPSGVYALSISQGDRHGTVRFVIVE